MSDSRVNDRGLQEAKVKALNAIQSLMDLTSRNQLDRLTYEQIKGKVKKAFEEPIMYLLSKLPHLYKIHLRLYDVFTKEIFLTANKAGVTEFREREPHELSLSNFYVETGGKVWRSIPGEAPVTLVIVTRTTDDSIPSLKKINFKSKYKVILIDFETYKLILEHDWDDLRKFPKLQELISELVAFLFKELGYRPPVSEEESLKEAYNIIKLRTKEKNEASPKHPIYFDYLIPAVFGKRAIYLLATYGLTEEEDPKLLDEITTYLGMMAGVVSYSYTQKETGEELEKREEELGKTYKKMFGDVLWQRVDNYLNKDEQDEGGSFAQILAQKLKVLRNKLFGEEKPRGEPAFAKTIFDEFQLPILENLSKKSKVGPNCNMKCEECRIPNYKNCLGRYLPLRILHNALDFEDTLKDMPRYRDHFIHSFHVFLLGYYVIQKCGYSNFAITKPKLEGKDEILKAWFFTAMYHDVSYPLAKVEDWLGTFYKRVVISPPIDTEEKEPPVNMKQELSHIFKFEGYQNALKLLYRGLDELGEIKAGDANETEGEKRTAVENKIMTYLLDQKDHGVLSSLLLLHSAAITSPHVDDRYHFQDPESIIENITPVRVAADAILWHDKLWEERINSGGIVNQVELKFEQNPIRNLLAFCDAAQEWGRPISGKPSPKDVFDLKLHGLTSLTEDEGKVIPIIVQVSLEPKEGVDLNSALTYYQDHWIPEFFSKITAKAEIFGFKSEIAPQIEFGRFNSISKRFEGLKKKIPDQALF